MATIDEIRKANIDKVNNIMNRFESPKEDSTLEMSEEQFNKAIETGEFSEVYTDGGLNKFGVEIRRRYAAGKLSNDDLEKAKKDLSKLVKVKVVDSRGHSVFRWVKRGEEPKKETKNLQEVYEDDVRERFSKKSLNEVKSYLDLAERALKKETDDVEKRDIQSDIKVFKQLITEKESDDKSKKENLEDIKIPKVDGRKVTSVTRSDKDTLFAWHPNGQRTTIKKTDSDYSKFEKFVEEFDAPHLTEQNFNKAIVDGLFNEVYDQAGITKYLQDLKKSIYENPDTDIEKAKKDLNKLIKIYKVDSTGKRNAYWVKRGEEPKGSERETSMNDLWWKLNKEEKNEYLIISRSNDSKRIEDFKQRMLGKYSGKSPKVEEKTEKKRGFKNREDTPLDDMRDEERFEGGHWKKIKQEEEEKIFNLEVEKELELKERINNKKNIKLDWKKNVEGDYEAYKDGIGFYIYHPDSNFYLKINNKNVIKGTLEICKAAAIDFLKNKGSRWGI